MKTLYCLLIILLCAAPLCAEQALVLTEIEKIQEKLWYLQKDLAAQKAELEKQQKQVGVLASQGKENQLQLDKRINMVREQVETQQAEAIKVRQNMAALEDTLATLATGGDTQQEVVLAQAERMRTLEGSLQELRAQLASTQTSTQGALAEMQAALTETRQQLAEARSQMTGLEQNVGGRVKQIGLWGAGAFLVLAVVLTIGFASRRNSPGISSSDRKAPPRHEM